MLYKFINTTKLKSVFYIVDINGETLLTSNYVKSPYNSYDIFISGLFKQLKNNPESIVYMNNKVQIDLTKRTIYSIGKAILINGEIKGYIVFDLLESDLEKEIFNNDSEILVVTDKYNNTIISSNSMFLDDIGKFVLKLDNNSESKVKYRDKMFYYNKSELFNGTLLIYTLSELNTINQVQDGNFNASVKIDSGDEFELIGKHFNKMVKRLDTLIKKNNELIARN